MKRKARLPFPIAPYIIPLGVALAIAVFSKYVFRPPIFRIMPVPTPVETQGVVQEAALVNLSSYGTTISLANDKGTVHAYAVKDGVQSNLDSGTLALVNGAFSEDGIRIQPTDTAGFVLMQDDLSVFVRYPLAVDLSSHAIFVTTSTGLHRLAVFPKQIVNSAIDTIKQMDLEQVGTQTVYKISGLKKVKLFGYIPFGITKTLRISVESGAVVSIEEDVPNRIFERLSH